MNSRITSFSCFLRGDFEKAPSGLTEVNCQTFAVIDENGSQLESLVFSQTFEKENLSSYDLGMVYRTKKFALTSALQNNDTVVVGATIYCKPHTLAASTS